MSRCATTAPLTDGDTIRIDVGQFLRCDFSERIIEEERNIIRSLEVVDVNHRFSNGEVALDGITFTLNRGELVCVMGASGCGQEHAAARCSAASCNRSHGEILLNGQSLYENLDALKRYVSYIPQDDAFDEHLTIGENLQFAAAIRSPHLSRRDRTRRLEGKLIELGLSERRDSIVGSPVKKTLSGGERKRLNIGLDMIGSADVYLFDEPTSGLVLEGFRARHRDHPRDGAQQDHHRHDPPAELEDFPDVSQGDPARQGRAARLLRHADRHAALFRGGGASASVRRRSRRLPACGTTRPEFIFDVLETPLRDLSGDIIYEENSRGQLMPARRYSPEFWRDKYEAFRLIQDVKQVPLRRDPVPPLPPAPPQEARGYGFAGTMNGRSCARCCGAPS